jgi:polysaccharide biosynthesis/export protein
MAAASQMQTREGNVIRARQTANAGKLIHRRGSSLHHCIRAAALVSALVFSFPLLADSAGDSGSYKLAPGDRITVVVFGQPELSGDMLVDGAGAIVVPFVGPIEVKNLTTLECQTLVRDRLADGILQQPSVSVRISELRPLHVLGDVRTPGAYPFRYGSTVQSAVAVAGGFGPPPLVQSAALSEFLVADERVRQLTFQKQALLLRQARLEAQRDGMKTFSPPAPQGTIQGIDLAGIVANETNTFETQAAILQNQVDLLRSQKPRIEKEIEALSGQIAAANKQLSLVRERADQYSRLMKQGLGLANSVLQLNLAEASHESELWRLTAQVSRLQMDAGELDLKIYEAEAISKRQLVAELRDARERLKELDVTLPSAREIREVKLQQAGDSAGAEAARFISITRVRNGQTNVFQATESTPLEPGDIIDVKKVVPHVRSGRASAKVIGLDSYQIEAAGRDRPSGSMPR